MATADDTSQKKRGPSDATDYSSTKAPETAREAEEDTPHPSDTRLIPGGAHGSATDPGMSSLHEDATIGMDADHRSAVKADSRR